MFVDRKIFPRNTNTTATAAQSKTTKAIAAIGDFFTGGVVVPKFVIAVGTSRLPAFCPVMINCTSSVAGDCGTMILLEARRTFHHRVAPPRLALDVLAANRTDKFKLAHAIGEAFHICAPLATGFFKGFFPASL
jgi:hypothetical protein